MRGDAGSCALTGRSDMSDAIPGLASLPALEELMITLSTEQEEEAVVTSLPGTAHRCSAV